MFANLFFLMLILFLTSMAQETLVSAIFPKNILLAFIASLVSYIATLFIFYIQSLWIGRKNKSKETLIFLSNAELVVFFIYAYFVLGTQRLFLDPSFPFGSSLFSLFSLSMYFAGLIFAHYVFERLTLTRNGAWKKALRAFRFLVPFSLPFLFFIAIGDALELIPYQSFVQTLGLQKNPFVENTIAILLIIAFMALAIIFLPPVIIYIWQCKRLHDHRLTTRLEALCERSRFKHAGFRIWSVMEGVFTAAIIGVIGKFRYVMFTQKLVDGLSPNSIEAILAHEIGHSHHKHLLLYPLILFGMVVSATLFASLFSYPLAQYFEQQDALDPSLVWKFLSSMTSFIPFIIVMALYFRFIFGYFSRLFERQADLHVFEVGVPPENLIQSLDELGTASGNIHLMPNWHHYSIQERINYIRDVQKDHSLLTKHYRKVRISLIIYFAALALAIAALVWLVV